MSKCLREKWVRLTSHVMAPNFARLHRVCISHVRASECIACDSVLITVNLHASLVHRCVNIYRYIRCVGAMREIQARRLIIIIDASSLIVYTRINHNTRRYTTAATKRELLINEILCVCVVMTKVSVGTKALKRHHPFWHQAV